MNYNALQAVLQKRYGNGLEAQISYTYEKCMTNDDGYYGYLGRREADHCLRQLLAESLHPHGDYAQCYWDSKHILSAYAVYEIPFGRGKQLATTCPRF